MLSQLLAVGVAGQLPVEATLTVEQSRYMWASGPLLLLHTLQICLP